jgi:microcystin-dependent protein
MIVAAKLTGTATKAESLVDGNSTLAASAIVRTNVENTIRYALNIAHNSGISIGGELGFSLGVTATSNEISSLLNDVSLDIKTRTNNETTILMRFDASTKRVGIGTTTPEELLHVGGNAQIDGQLIIDSTSSNSIATAGGVEIGGNAVIGGTVALAGQLLIGPLNSGVPVPEAIMPTVTDVYDQGSPTRRYRNIYADTFVGDRFVGDLEGNLLGVALSASTLASVTEFGIVGDVTCTPVNFNGAQSQVTFTTELTNNVIIGKEATSVSYSNDRLLIFRNAGGDIGLRSISKATLTSNLATVPVGTILAYGGMVPPTGYAFCDGGELRIANFPTLFSVIGYSYKAQELLSSVEMFGLPFLNGRIPIGRDNMGGQAAHNITGIAGSTLGGTGGSESVSLVEGNMPSHSHSIDSFTEEMHFANGSGVAALARSADTEQTSSIGTGTPFVTLPPYQVVNYIIYTGVM